MKNFVVLLLLCGAFSAQAREPQSRKTVNNNNKTEARAGGKSAKALAEEEQIIIRNAVTDFQLRGGKWRGYGMARPTGGGC